MDAKNDIHKLFINIPKYMSTDKQPAFASEQAQAEVAALIKAKVAAGEDLPQRVDVEVKSDYFTFNYQFEPTPLPAQQLFSEIADSFRQLEQCSNTDKNP